MCRHRMMMRVNTLSVQYYKWVEGTSLLCSTTLIDVKILSLYFTRGMSSCFQVEVWIVLSPCFRYKDVGRISGLWTLVDWRWTTRLDGVLLSGRESSLSLVISSIVGKTFSQRLKHWTKVTELVNRNFFFFRLWIQWGDIGTKSFTLDGPIKTGFPDGTMVCWFRIWKQLRVNPLLPGWWPRCNAPSR